MVKELSRSVDVVAERGNESVGVVVKCPVHSLGSPEVLQLIALAESRDYSQYLPLTNNGRLRPEAALLAGQAASGD